MADVQALRRPPAKGLALVADQPQIALTTVDIAGRFAARGDAAAASAIGRAFQVDLPLEPLQSASHQGRTALWLGPDEWLLLADNGDPAEITAAVVAAVGDQPYSWVDVSHRNAGYLLSGTCVCDVLTAGCPLPLDLSAFPVGKCARTLFGKAEIVLWRVGEASFRIEVWRSFAAYVAGLISDAAREHRL